MSSVPRTVCHINLARHFRGGERQTEILIIELAKRGWRQRLVVREGQPLVERLAGFDELDIRVVSSNPVSAAFACKGADLNHAHEARGIYAAWLARRFFATPYILTRRVVNPQKPSLVRASAYSSAAATVAVSRAAAIEMQKHQPDVEPRVIPDASAAFTADPAEVEAIRARFPGRKLIGHVGALDDATKGQRTLFEVARAAETEAPDWQFLFVGDGADYEAFLEETAGLANVHFEGFVNNVGDYLAAFDVFVFPSNQEAVGSTLVDAMQSGLPIVASRTGGIPEIIVEGRNGVLMPPKDAGGFMAAIDVLLNDEEERERLRAHNIEDARKYAASEMAAAYELIYRRALNARA